MRAFLRRVSSVVLVTAVLTSVAVAMSTAASATPAPVWKAPHSVDVGSRYLTSVSCASSTFCMAVDASGNAVHYNGTTWSMDANVDLNVPLYSVSCVSSSFCQAVDLYGQVVTYDGTSWSTPIFWDASGQLNSVSCTSTSFCVAVDTQGNAITYDGSTWSADATIDATNNVTSVSCTSSTFCMAVDTSGNAVAYNGTDWTTLTTWTNPVAGDGFSSVSCTSSTFCMAVDPGGDAYSYNGTTWAAPVNIPAGGLSAVSCSSSTFCMATDYTGDAISYNGTSWSAATNIDTTNQTTSISCTSTTFCMATDTTGNAINYAVVPTAPGAPRPTSAVPFGDHAAKVIWIAPANNGGSAITSYVVTPYLAGVPQPAHVFNSTATTETVSGLGDAKAYTFAVAARNAIGTGPKSVQTAAITVGAPGQPGKATVAKIASGSLKATFAAPMNDGATITKFTVTCSSSNGGATKSVAGARSPLTVTGLTATRSYTCTVTATNSRGTGPRSTPSTAVTA